MKVTKELFNKLPQLDRIEFRQRHPKNSGMFYALFGYLTMFISVSLAFISTSVFVFLLVFISFFLGFLLYNIGFGMHSDNMEKLEEEYFEVVIKKHKEEK